MSDLAAALDSLEEFLRGDQDGKIKFDPASMIAAARRQLPLEPVECGMCGGNGPIPEFDGFDERQCPMCLGRGWSYQPGTVEAVAEAIHGEPWADISSKDRPYVVDQAVAVLDALRTLTQEAL